MKIIITGATGSLGAFLTRWYAARRHEVIAVGRIQNPPIKLRACAQYLRADITKPFMLPDADVCIHAAGLADDKAGPSDLQASNVDGTTNVAAAARNCKMFVHVSTSSVYPHTGTILSEEMAAKIPAKLSHYGKSKWLAETILRDDFRFDACFILRPRGLYGAGDKVLLPRLLRLVNNGKMISPGKMDVRLSMTHFSNFAIAVDKCIASGLDGLHTYNVADDKTYFLNDVVRKLLHEIYGYELEERKLPLWLLRCMALINMGEVTPLFLDTVSKDFVLDLAKAKSELRYTPLADLDGSLNEIATWVKSVGGVSVLRNAEPRLAWDG